MSIRTTVTLDEDVFERTTDLSKMRRIPFRQALNDLVRAGLQAESAARPKRRFRIRPHHMGVRPGLNYDNMEGLL
jgi:hypothetical protein